MDFYNGKHKKAVIKKASHKSIFTLLFFGKKSACPWTENMTKKHGEKHYDKKYHVSRDWVGCW